jgi:hypothetical protein
MSANWLGQPVTSTLPTMVVRRITDTSLVALDGASDSTTTIYTSAGSVDAGYYFINVTFTVGAQPPTAFNAAESMFLQVIGNANFQTSTCSLSFDPFYQSIFEGTNAVSVLSASGIMIQSGTGQIAVTIQRRGTTSANKYGQVYSLTYQKLASYP